MRAQAKTSQYEVESLRQEREYTKLQHERELRDAHAKAEADFKRAQVKPWQINGLRVADAIFQRRQKVART